MNAVPKRILISVAGLVLLLMGLNLWLWPNQALQQSHTSFGIMPYGYKAAFDLLSELHFPVMRSYRRPRLMPTTQTAWFVAPSFLIGDQPHAHDDAHEAVEWASRGGTAVIFGEADSDWKTIGLAREVEPAEKKDADRVLIKGDLVAQPRWLEIKGLLHFSAPSDVSATSKDAKESAHEQVRMTADGQPFALEREVGTHHGRIIAIADDSFFRNDHLADADASVVLVDLVHAFGPPVFDEHSHGILPAASLTAAILDSRALLPIAVGLLAAMLWVFSQRAWPRRTLDDQPGLPAASIASFVESLAILYARASDPAAVFRAYRSGFLRRLRRQIGVRGDYPEARLLERVARDRSLAEDTRHWLLAPDVPVDQHHLVSAVRALESYPRSAR